MAGTSGGSGNETMGEEEGEWEYYDDDQVLPDFWQVGVLENFSADVIFFQLIVCYIRSSKYIFFYVTLFLYVNRPKSLE